jgi:hypothetical protein
MSDHLHENTHLLLPTAVKSKQKKPLEGNALHPIILRIKQGSIGFLKKHGFAQLNNLTPRGTSGLGADHHGRVID